MGERPRRRCANDPATFFEARYGQGTPDGTDDLGGKWNWLANCSAMSTGALCDFFFDDSEGPNVDRSRLDTRSPATETGWGQAERGRCTVRPNPERNAALTAIVRVPGTAAGTAAAAIAVVVRRIIVAGGGGGRRLVCGFQEVYGSPQLREEKGMARRRGGELQREGCGSFAVGV